VVAKVKSIPAVPPSVATAKEPRVLTEECSAGEPVQTQAEALQFLLRCGAELIHLHMYGPAYAAQYRPIQTAAGEPDFQNYDCDTARCLRRVMIAPERLLDVIAAIARELYAEDAVETEAAVPR
jgi:hypothetical protein